MGYYTLNDIKYKIHEVRTLNKNDDKAKRILLKAAEEVMPIMKKRCWSIRVLSEFLPRSQRLMGRYIPNKQEINVRLRKFKCGNIYHYSHIIGTLLHELTHIVCSRHDKKFQALFTELVNEYNELYTPKGTVGQGRTTGSPGSDKSFLKVSPRFMAALATERRLQQAGVSKESHYRILDQVEKTVLENGFQENYSSNEKSKESNKMKKVYTICSSNILCYIDEDTNIIENDDQAIIKNINTKHIENRTNISSQNVEKEPTYPKRRNRKKNKTEDDDVVILVSDKNEPQSKSRTGSYNKIPIKTNNAKNEIYDLTTIPLDRNPTKDSIIEIDLEKEQERLYNLKAEKNKRRKLN